MLSRTWRNKSKEKQEEIINFENTFRLDPFDGIQPKMAALRSLLKETLEFYFRNCSSYQSTKCGQMSKFIAEDIKGKVNKLGFSRYKCVSHVIIGQNLKQNISISSCCLWNAEFDHAADFMYTSNDIYAIAFVYTLYYE
ncbi:hypothetical protein CAPTEDRAFT_94298 [Capitella teleta]|uniref:Dynein light chain n=1 Tax=Capitella teleta TaxID=283909 RepID=R7UBE0_CAPTE|nr:hypothetical protein CAPTEDRAFT_94298 [Capitella teleta]|eukprot:ELU01118.1 hypothetical protein CAPTEDRAFT_94298 [Capitella teleta]